MSREVPALGTDEGLVQASLQDDLELVAEPFSPTDYADAAITQDSDAEYSSDLLVQATRLQAKTKVALIRKLITQLETDQIHSILESGLKEIGNRYRHGSNAVITNHNTRLLLKKDYSFQERGLDEPSQYYVYLRRRKPKLDRYIGALFYIPGGCTLSYFLDAEGRIVFNPPSNIFQLQDSKNPSVMQTVRLVCLQPPPPDYTFTKQQNDTPEIYLHLEYLDSKTYQPLSTQVYPFPACMHEGGKLDRYRWEVSMLKLSPEVAEPSTTHLSNTNYSLERELSRLPEVVNADGSPIQHPSKSIEYSPSIPATTSSQSSRRVLEISGSKPLTLHLCDSNHADAILKRMRLWVSWSEKAMPQSKWEIVQNEDIYKLMNARFKRQILSFSRTQLTVTLENSLPVLVKWFHDLSLSVSQAQNQRQYSTAQLKLAHSLFVDMSLPQKDPVVMLKKLFGVEFSKEPRL